MTQYVLLDTNILFRYVTQGEPGCEQEHFDALKEFVSSGKAKLFRSEVVELEFGGQCKGLEDRLKKEIREIEERLTTALQGVIGESFPTGKRESNKKAWNEISDLHPWLKTETDAFSKKLKQWPEDKLKEATERIVSVNSLFNLDSVERLPFDQEVMLRTKKRFMAKRFKQYHRDSKPEADYNIVDSVVRYFENRKGNDQVLFCSANTNDLAVEVEGKFLLHPTIKDDFPSRSALFLTLTDLVTSIRDQRPLDEPSPEKVQQAVDRERRTPISVDGYWEHVRRFNAAIDHVRDAYLELDGADQQMAPKVQHIIQTANQVAAIAKEPILSIGRLSANLDLFLEELRVCLRLLFVEPLMPAMLTDLSAASACFREYLEGAEYPEQYFLMPSRTW